MTGIVPLDWRRANVVPIFKKGTKSLPSNYRPVSLTSIVGKILERLIKDHMDEFLLEKKLSKQQTAWIHERQKLSDKPDLFL